MTLLLRDPDTQAEAPAGAAPPEARACPSCQAPLEEDQDWCLSCGASQSSRGLALPGKRATATVLALTTVLVGGAVAASYAALTGGSATPTTPTQVAQVPATAASPSATAPAPAATAPAAPSTAVPSTTTPPATATPPAADSTPVTPTPSASSTPSSSSASDSTSADTTTAGSGTDTPSSSHTDTTADTRTSTSTVDTKPVAIKLGDTAAGLYDPYKRDTAAGDVEKAFDGDPNTSFPVTVAAGSTTIGAGLTVDLGTKQGIREIDLTTKTPGFKIEIYATDDADVPPDVLDTRWAHLKDVTGVGSDQDGKETVDLGSGTTKYRHVLLWFTAPPTDGSTVRISELKLLG